MRRLLAIVGALTALFALPLGLVGPTSWLLLPVHASLTAIAIVGAGMEASRGAPERARLWGFAHLLVTLGTVVSIDVGRRVSGGVWWVVPWLGILAWGWIPIVVAGGAGQVAEVVSRWRSKQVIRQRRKELPWRAR